MEQFLIYYTLLIAFMLLLMVVIVVCDHIKVMRPFWEIEKRYKKELESLRKIKNARTWFFCLTGVNN